ncbi:all-trans-retinol 13,14-reductase [Bacteroidia bacterium]|nr:all-trans-retinol 13,14-reductase [Bacteroidia bacterium]
MEKYDVTIIGSGLGGLVCADILSKEGYKVCVLEKNADFGGCLRSYIRKGRILDTGIHYAGSLDEGQILNQYFKYTGIRDKLKIKRMDEDGFDIIHRMGKEYKYAMGHENFIETLSQNFPKEKENIRKIIKTFKNIGDLISVDHLKQKKNFSSDGMHYFNTSISDFLKECTDNADLRSVISGTSMQCGEEENTSLYVFSTIINSSIESAYRFVDGSQQVADLLIESIKSHGGEVRNKAEATRLITHGKIITCAEINGNELIESKYFISGIHPSGTLKILEKTPSLKKAHFSRVNSLKNSFGFFTLSIILKGNTFPYLNRNYYYHDENSSWVDSNCEKQGMKKVLFCTPASSYSEQYAKTAQILEPMYWHEVEKWEHTTLSSREADYTAFKQKRAETLIEYIAKYQPQLKGAIETYSTSTPLTYRDYTGTKNGSAYGIVKDYNHALKCLLPSKTKVPNLFITGQNNNVHGMIGVFMTAMYTCSELLGTQYLAEKVANA